MSTTLLKNVASQRVRVYAYTPADGLPKTGDAANLTCYIAKDYGAVTALADTSATEEDATNAPGYYWFDIAQTETNADNILVTAKSSTSGVKVLGAPAVIGTRPATGFLAPATAGRTLVVDASGLADANTVKIGPTGSGTAQTARDLGASVLLSAGTGTGQLDFTSGVVKSNLAQILGTALTETAGQIAAAFKKFFNVATPTGTVNSIPDAVAGANGGLGTVDASNRVAGIQGTTKHTLDDLNDLSGTSMASAVWNALTSGMSTAGSIGKRIVDYLTGDVFARVGAPAGASLAADVAAVKAVDDAIKLKTDNLPSDPADESLVIAATDAIYNRLGAPAGASVSADVAAVKGDTAAILVDTGTTLDGRIPAALTTDGNMKSDALRINGNANAAARLALSAAEIRPGTVDSTAFTPTTTEFECDDVTEAAPDFWNGAIIQFTSGALRSQKTTVSDYSVVSGRGHFTVVALTSAPADNVTFVAI